MLSLHIIIFYNDQWASLKNDVKLPIRMIEIKLLLNVK